MKRLFLFTVLLAMAAVSAAQVTVTNGGFATQSGPAYPAAPSSPPVVFAPIVHLDQGQTQPMQATAETNGVTPAPEVQQQPQQAETFSAQHQQPFNFGVAQVGAASSDDTDGKSLGEIARDMRQKPNGTNARVYTNNDIQNLGGSSVGGAAAAATNSTNADNWSPNNGVINPDGMAPSSVAAPAQNQSTTGTQGPRSPFAAPMNAQPNSTGVPQDNSPQAQNEPQPRPFAQRAGTTEMAQNNPPANPADQNAAQSNSSTTQSDNDKSLPKTASRLPLLGVLGLFTVFMGVFVRYQRAKAR